MPSLRTMTTDWLTIKKLGEEELARLDSEYRAELSTKPAEREEAWESWNSFFAQANPNTDWEYRWSYFRWYTDLTWLRFGKLTEEEILKMAFGRQVPTALWSEIDVWQDLMFYFDDLVDPELVESAYGKIRQAFFASEAVVGMWQNKMVTVAELVKDIKIINQPNADTLRSAEILSKIKQIFTQSNNEKYALASVDWVVDRFVGLVNFFLGVEPKGAWVVADHFVNPEKYEESDEDSTDVETTIDVPTEQTESEPVNSVPPEVETVVPVEEPPAAPAMGYADIKNMVEARFTHDATGEFTNLDGVLALLETLANDQGDDQIRELYYFDEGAGKFQWNDALLT